MFWPHLARCPFLCFLQSGKNLSFKLFFQASFFWLLFGTRWTAAKMAKWCFTIGNAYFGPITLGSFGALYWIDFEVLFDALDLIF